MMKKLFLLLTLALSACSSLLGNDALDDLKDRQQKWTSLGITSYTFDYARSCFCGGPFGPVRIVVRNGQIVSATELQPTQPAQPLPPNWAKTIDQLFAELIRTAEDAHELRLTFDTQFHFPAEVSADPIKNAIDDEFSLRLTNFQPHR